MKPFKFEVEKIIKSSAKEVCDKILDVTTWSDFDGHGVLPGIDGAVFELKTDNFVGSQIRVKNSDGTGHIEEIIEWEANKKLVMKLHKFPKTLSYMATHFIEEWHFAEIGENEVHVLRVFKLFPMNFVSRPLLKKIAVFMKKAVIKHLDDMAKEYEKV